MSDDFTVVGRVVIESDDAALARLKEETTGAGSGAASLGSAASGAESELAGLGGAAGVAAEEHKGLGAAEEEAEGKTSKLGGSMGSLVGAIGGSVVALKAAEWFKSAGEEAMASDQNIALMSNAMEKNAGASKSTVAATESWIDAQARATGISHDQIDPAYTKLIDTTHNVKESQSLLTTAMNISAETHKPLIAVTTALAKASEGSAGGLSRYGIATKDASGKTESFKQIVENANKVYGGDAAKAADTTAGRVAKLGENYSQLKEHIGNELMPAEMKLASVGMDLVSGFEKLPGPLQDVIVIGGGLVAVLGGAAVAANALGLGAAASAIASGIASAASGVWTAAQWLLNAALDANPIGIVVVAIAALVAGVVLAYEHIGAFRDIVDDLGRALRTAWDGIKKGVETVWNWIVGAFKKYGGDILIAITGPVGLLVAEVAKHWDTIKADAKKAWDTVTSDAKTAWNAIEGAIKTIVGDVESWLRTAWSTVTGDVKTGWNAVTGAMKTAWNDISSAVTTGISNVIDLVTGLPDQIVSALGDLSHLLYKAGASIIDGLISGIESVIGKLTSVLGDISKLIPLHKGPASEDAVLLTPAGSLIMQGLIDGIQSQRAALVSTLAGVTADIGAGFGGGSPLALAGAGGGAGGGSVVNNYSYNLTVNSAANTEPILADFATLRSMNTRSS